MQVAVIGAGISGLAAAHKLYGSGREVSVIEARDRIGGRIWTSADLGAPIDLGAAWIHGIEDNPISGLAEDLNLRRVPTSDSYVVRGSDGRKLDWMSAPGWFFEDAEIQTAFGADADLIDPGVLELDDGYGGGDVTFPAGYSAILGALEGDYSVELSRLVQSISIAGSNVTLGFEGGSSSPYDAAIVTVPLGVLKAQAITFDPPLPDAKRKAIMRMGMGTLDKVALRFEEVFWDEADWIYTPRDDLPRGQFSQWFNLHPTTGLPIIVALNGGPAALALSGKGDEEVVQMALETLANAYSG